MNGTTTRHHRHWITALALSAVTLALAGCASLSAESGATRYAAPRALASEKIFLGNETITVRGIGANRERQLNRYTCGPRGVMMCDYVASITQCSCYRR